MARGRAPVDPLAQLARARVVDAKISTIVGRQRLDVVALAYALAEMDAGRLWAACGCADLVSYAAKRDVGYSASQVRQLVAMVKKLEGLPQLKAAFQSGTNHWTKVREAARVATVENEAQLVVDLALTYADLTSKLRRERGEPEVHRVVVELTPEELGFFEHALHAARTVDRHLTNGAAIGLICRAFVQGGAAKDGSPTTRLVLYRNDAGRTTIETRDGPVAVSPARLEQAMCNVETLDIRDGRAKLTRNPPPRVANRVQARDRGRCQAPGCRSMGFLHQHHEPGRREVGHDPDKMLTLCESHHTARHDGSLGIDPIPGGFAFSQADGTPLGSVVFKDRAADQAGTDAAAQHDASAPPEAPHESPVVAQEARPDPAAIERTVLGGLTHGLGVPKRGALGLVRAALKSLAAAGVPLTEEALLREALVLMPTPCWRSG